MDWVLGCMGLSCIPKWQAYLPTNSLSRFYSIVFLADSYPDREVGQTRKGLMS